MGARRPLRVGGASYRPCAREVIPHRRGRLQAPKASHDGATATRRELFGAAGQAVLDAITSDVEEKQAASTTEGT
ncbi:MAG TPA: hypothetical protein VFI47_02550 [Acidimicrobiales bacterium]|nr:hypothetical protein [Acidimicrobiales bacterium]